MKIFILSVLLFIYPILAMAQVNWSSTDALISNQPETVSFGIEVPYNSVETVVAALCSNHGLEVSGDNAKQVVINYITAQVKYYQQQQALLSAETQEIQIK